MYKCLIGSIIAGSLCHRIYSTSPERRSRMIKGVPGERNVVAANRSTRGTSRVRMYRPKHYNDRAAFSARSVRTDMSRLFALRSGKLQNQGRWLVRPLSRVPRVHLSPHWYDSENPRRGYLPLGDNTGTPGSPYHPRTHAATGNYSRYKQRKKV